jgi:hypothetical protein
MIKSKKAMPSSARERSSMAARLEEGGLRQTHATRNPVGGPVDSMCGIEKIDMLETKVVEDRYMSKIF